MDGSPTTTPSRMTPGRFASRKALRPQARFVRLGPTGYRLPSRRPVGGWKNVVACAFGSARVIHPDNAVLTYRQKLVSVQTTNPNRLDIFSSCIAAPDCDAPARRECLVVGFPPRI